MAQIVFTITIFVSAFMLFLVQPLIGKLILPKLGGTPQVWNTCMVFFQTVLLAGYAYTHTVSSRLKLRQQLMFHAAMLGIPFLILIAFPMYAYTQNWQPPTEGNPVYITLLLLATVVGIPFFVVSTSAPLLQRWFAYSGHPNAKDPYFLYSASNAGSLLSLLVYPAGIEPSFFLQTQTYIWLAGYAVLVGLILYCAYVIFQTAPSDEQIAAEAARADAIPDAPPPAPEPPPMIAAEASTAVKPGPAPSAASRGIQRKKGAKLPGKAEEEKEVPIAAMPSIARGATAPMTNWRRFRWVLLAAVPSSLMLGVTSYISTDLSPFPLVWVIPLALYLLSFILVYMKTWTSKRYPIFSPEGYTLHQMMVFVGQPLGLIILCFIILTRRFDPFYATGLTMLGFFANALACHGELAEDRPDPKHLTEYFLFMSIGGAIGGILNGLVAPVVFQKGILEFYIAIVVACFIRPSYVTSGWFDELILNAFPQFRNWATNQGDEMAKSMGKQPPHTTYLFSYILDIVFGVFILSIAYWLKIQGDEAMRDEQGTHWLTRLIKFSSASEMFVLNAVMFGVPMVFCFFFAGRAWRFGLAVLGLLLGSMYLTENNERILEARRTYFGVLRVIRSAEMVRNIPEIREFTKPLIPGGPRQPRQNKEGEIIPPVYRFTYLMHGTTDHGRNYVYDPSASEHNKIFDDISRLATTYYHRYGPVGVVMERDNWFKGRQNSFAADARFPVTAIMQMMNAVGVGTIPLEPIVGVWSEPPFATIGLGTGTMASYVRPFQHMTYYEIDEVIRGFSIPEEGAETRFTFVEGAIRRGGNMHIAMGDARQSLEPRREFLNFRNTYVYTADFKKFASEANNPKDRFYSRSKYDNSNNEERKHKFEEVLNKEPDKEKWKDLPELKQFSRDRFYKVINVDAFSSDAIPVHLVTKQAIEIYLQKLRDDGVLCVHTSNRHMDLVRPVARIALELSEIEEKKAKEEAEKLPENKREEYIASKRISCLVGKDDRRGRASQQPTGHTGSEYVMIFRGDGFKNWIEYLKTEAGKIGDGNEPPVQLDILNSQVVWYNPWEQHLNRRHGLDANSRITKNDSLWTDDYSYILGVLR